METKRFVFDDWSDGEFGDMPPEQASAKAFTGSNVVRYRKGHLGPRPGLAKIDTTNNVAGRVWGFYAPTVLGARLVMVIGDRVYRANSDFDIDLVEFGTGSPIANEPDSVVPFTVVELGHQIYFSVPGHNLYEMDCLDDTLTEVLFNAATSVGPVAIKAYRDRLYYAGDDLGGDIWQVFYSEPADFTNFPSTNFFSVGYGIAVYLMEGLANNLMIGTRLTWWALVGGTITGSLREVYTSAAPGKAHTTAVHEGLIWYWSYTFGGGAENGGENGQGRLAFTNGTIFNLDDFNHLTLSGLKFGLVAPALDAIIFSSDDARIDGSPGGCALLRLNDAWAYQDFEVETTGPVANVTDTTRFVFVGSDRGTSAVYSITITATGGTFDLTTDRGNLLAIPSTITLPELQGLVFYGITGGCEVTAGVGPVDFVLTFTGSNQGIDPNCAIDDTNATGGTVVGADTVTGAPSEADYYQMRLDLERPAFIGDVLANPGDDSNTPIDAHFHTMLARHPEGREMRVRKVFVEIQKWNTGVTDNTLTVEVRSFGRNAVDGYHSETNTWTEAASATAAGDEGEAFVVQQNFEARFGTGFQIGITGLVGCAVNRIVVEVDIEPGRQEGA